MPGEWTLTVGQLNEYVRKTLAGDPMLRGLRVEGELSGVKRHFSGHIYFTLKDETARVQGVMFRSSAQGLDFEPKDGMRVVVRGSASLYPQTGTFQIYADGMERQGVGELYLRFEQLKRRLSEEGLFDPAVKREIPAFPQTIGVVTSRTGAVLRDIVRVARRRNPNVSVLVAPAGVQGAGAAEEIARAIALLNRQGEADVILCGRGGGSIEDLWPFNEEIVARAIRASKIPVISCVGHETDFTIADFAADLRAPTPSAAAELAVPDAEALRGALDGLEARSGRAVQNRLRLARERLDRLESAPGRTIESRLRLARERLGRLTASPAMAMPEKIMIENRRVRLESLISRLESAGGKRAGNERNRLETLARALSAVNPEAVMERGYAVVRQSGKAVSGLNELETGMIEVRMRDGEASACVVDIKEKRHGEECVV